MYFFRVGKTGLGRRIFKWLAQTNNKRRDHGAMPFNHKPMATTYKIARSLGNELQGEENGELQ